MIPNGFASEPDVPSKGTGPTGLAPADALAAFKSDMREQGIHVGVGMPGVCVTCDEPWPCEGSKS